MPSPKALRHGLLVLVLGAVSWQSLPAQTVLVVDYKGKPTPVVGARGSKPLVEDRGKLIVSYGDQFGFARAKEFLPVFIAVRNIRVRTSHVEVNGSGAINNEFHFHGDFSTAYPLADVYAVFEMHSDAGDKSLFLYDLGRMDPNDPRQIDLVVPTSFRVGSGHYRLHLYTQGMEVFNSQQPLDFREAALNRIVAHRIKGRKDGPPVPFIGPPPEYPSKLKNDGVRGRAVIHLRILATGAVVDPVVTSATNPAFGESAVAALRQWRFLPEIKHGYPVATTANLPVDFAPPHKA